MAVKLYEPGSDYAKRLIREGKAVRDDRGAWSERRPSAVTGQNPASSTEVAEEAVGRLGARVHFVHVVPHHGEWTTGK